MKACRKCEPRRSATIYIEMVMWSEERPLDEHKRLRAWKKKHTIRGLVQLPTSKLEDVVVMLCSMISLDLGTSDWYIRYCLQATVGYYYYVQC